MRKNDNEHTQEPTVNLYFRYVYLLFHDSRVRRVEGRLAGVGAIGGDEFGDNTRAARRR